MVALRVFPGCLGRDSCGSYAALKSPQEIPCGLGSSFGGTSKTFIYSFMDSSIYTSTDSIITSTFAALGVCPAVRWTAVTDSCETSSPCGVCVHHSRAVYWQLLAVWSQSLSSVPRHGAHSAPQLPTAAAAPSRDPAVSGMSCGWRGGSPTPGSPASRSQLTQNHW